MKLNEELEKLYEQKRILENKIFSLEEKLKLQNTNKELDKNEKINLFKELFIARDDIYAKEWISKDGLKKAFYPQTRTFKGNDFVPLTNSEIESHLRGQIHLASYVINKENKSKFVVLEILLKDIKTLVNNFVALRSNFFFEYSSYNSVFLWIFFDVEIESKNAKKFAEYILRKSAISAKIYPNRDFVNNANLGELIELPLHLKYRNENKTIFFDPNSNTIYEDQWQLLQSVKKIKKETVSKYIDFESVSCNNLLFEEVSTPTFKLNIKIYDFIYIPTKNLSATLINRLKSFATFDNPQIKVLLQLRKPLYNTPKLIKNFEEDEVYLKLPRGLVYKLKKYFDENNINYEFEDKTFFEKIETKKVKFTLRKEQNEAIKEISKYNFSICVAPPGFGKTLIGAKMFEIRTCSTLIIVNKNMLLSQWIERFIEYFGYEKKDIGYLGKGKNKLNGLIDVATMQSLKNSPDIINNYSFVIVDECHHIPAITFEQIVKQFFGKYILGLSATPNRKDGLEPILFQQLGKTSYEFKKKKTFNNKLEIIKTDFVSQADNYASLVKELCLDENRNNLIINQILIHKNRKILVLTDRIEHINILEKKLLENNIDFLSIHGSLNKKIQNERIKQIEQKSLILATTSYFGEGIDFPHLNTIIFATPISYYGRLIQYLGRIGRGNQECLSIDFLDNKNAMLNSAYKKRLEGYKQMHYI